MYTLEKHATAICYLQRLFLTLMGQHIQGAHNMWDGVTNSFCIGIFFRIETRLLLISWDIFNPCAFRLEEFLGHLLFVCIRIRVKRHSFQKFSFATILNTAKGIL